MKKPLNYFGFAFDDPSSGYNRKYINSKEGQKEIKKIKKRYKKYRKDLKKQGFDSTETWNLDNTIIQFTLPRLKYFRKNLHGYPADITFKKWKKILDTIIFAFETHIENDCIKDEKIAKKVSKGFTYFGKYLRNLWD